MHLRAVRSPLILTGLLSIAATATTASPQASPRTLSLVQDGRIEIAKSGGSREVFFAPGPNGTAVLAPRFGWDGNIIVYDSTGTPLPWKVATGRNDKAEIMFPSRVGWIGGTATMWVADPGYKQVVLVDGQGKVTKSIENASWIHPHWGERRAYPVFARMDPLAVYGDQTMLILPGNERSLISTPGYDRTVGLHLLRVTWNGAIERTVATVPDDHAVIDLRGKTGLGHVLNIPFVPRASWAVSSDGLRVAVATPGVSIADSGTIRVTVLDDRGDTVFARRYPTPAVRVRQDMIDRFLASIQTVGTISAATLRDSASKQIPAFQSLLTSVMVGYDHSTWVMLRAPSDTSKERRAMVLDPKGDLVGLVTIPLDQMPAAVSLGHLWAFEIGRMRTATSVIRYAVGATGAPPVRSAKASASSTRSSPPR